MNIATKRIWLAALGLCLALLPTSGLAAAPQAAEPGQAPPALPAAADSAAAGASAAGAARTDMRPNSPLDAAIDAWVKTLSAQTGFEDWQGATWTSHPLGPGTHSWAVLVRRSGRDVGYLIVTAGRDPENPYVLAEYGCGDSPLFSSDTLATALSKEGLQDLRDLARPIYYSPFHAYWKITSGGRTILVDAKTGELYPATGVPAEIVKYGGASVGRLANGSLAKLREEVRLAAFDPFDRVDWIAHEPTEFRDMDALKQALRDGKRITVTVDIFDGEMVLPFALTGYQQWSEGEPYLALEEMGVRYIPYNQVVRWGKLYASAPLKG